MPHSMPQLLLLRCCCIGNTVLHSTQLLPAAADRKRTARPFIHRHALVTFAAQLLPLPAAAGAISYNINHDCRACEQTPAATRLTSFSWLQHSPDCLCTLVPGTATSSAANMPHAPPASQEEYVGSHKQSQQLERSDECARALHAGQMLTTSRTQTTLKVLLIDGQQPHQPTHASLAHPSNTKRHAA